MALKSSPPVAVAAVNAFSDVSLPHIVNVLTALYLLLMIAHKAWTMFREYKAAERAAAYVPRSKDRRARPRDTDERRTPNEGPDS